jgi:predicted transcriptional regulator of viral defense system
LTRKTPSQKLTDYVREKGMIRAHELDALGIPRVYLSRLVKKGTLERVNRGLYQMAGADITEHFTLAQAAKIIPNGVVCLLSALNFHGFTTQLPFQVWIAVERGKWEAGTKDLPLRIFEFSGKSFQEGIETHTVQGVGVKVYGPAKTVADCFKYRNKIGLDVALEALRECQREKKCTSDDVWHFAKVCRVTNVMRPYMEAMV